jgi:hypothetical protein
VNFLQIPESVLVHASKLSGLQLAILADAWTWEKNGKEARRSNDQLAELFGATTRGVTKAVKTLQELGLVELQYGANNIRYIKPRTTVHLNDRSPRTTVHPERPFDAAPNDRSTPPERPFTPSPERPFTLIEKVIENKEEKRIEKKERAKKIEIVMPWPSDEFAQAWADWKEYKRAEKGFKFKSPKTEQTALHKLQNDAERNERLAIFAIATSISNGWSGIFINAKLKREFQNQQPAGGDVTADEFAEYLRTGAIPWRS